MSMKLNGITYLHLYLFRVCALFRSLILCLSLFHNDSYFAPLPVAIYNSFPSAQVARL